MAPWRAAGADEAAGGAAGAGAAPVSCCAPIGYDRSREFFLVGRRSSDTSPRVLRAADIGADNFDRGARVRGAVANDRSSDFLQPRRRRRRFEIVGNFNAGIAEWPNPRSERPLLRISLARLEGERDVAAVVGRFATAVNSHQADLLGSGSTRVMRIRGIDG